MKQADQGKFYFLMAVRHPETVKDVDHQMACFEEVFACLKAQSDQNFELLIGCNEGQMFPDLPSFVSFAPNTLPPLPAKQPASNTREAHYRAFPKDKGTRISKCFSRVKPSDMVMVMVIDDDDLIHRDLVKFIRSHPPQGWVIDRGYAWRDTSSVVTPVHQLHRLCGTTVVVPASYYRWYRAPDDCDAAIRELGGHTQIVNDAIGSPDRIFSRIPFPAAIYRRGHVNSNITDLRKAEGQRRRASLRDRLHLMRKRLKHAFGATSLTDPGWYDHKKVKQIDAQMRRDFWGADSA